MTEKKLLVKGRFILTMDSEMRVIEDGGVLISGNSIEKILAKGESPKARGFDIFDAGNSIIMPGLINAHTHAAMSYFRGMADDLPLDIWLNKHIWPAEAKYLNADFVRKASELAILEMLSSGITCFNDMYFFADITAEVAQSAGIRAVLGEGIIDFPTPAAKTPDIAIEKTLYLYERFKDSELISASLNPHSVYAVDRELLIFISKLSGENCLPIHVHVSETEKEISVCRDKFKMTPVEYLDDLGFLSENVIAAHCVHLSDKDIKCLKARNVKVSHNPISNMKLASGIAPIPKLLKDGITVGLGTDGAASNNTLDLFSEMRTCALLHKAASLNPTEVSAKAAVAMATSSAAEALGMGKITGSLEAGKRADLAIIDLDRPHLQPIHDPYSHLVYCANSADVASVVINGKFAVKDREILTMDSERIIREAVEFKI